jgi:hypothetical protein
MSDDKDMVELYDLEMAELRAKRQRIWDKISPLQAEVLALHDKLRDLQSEKNRLLIKSWKEPDWAYLIKALASDDMNSRELLHYADKELRERYDMYHSCYWADTNEANFQVKVERNDESERKNLEGVKFFTRLMTPHKEIGEEHELVWFGLFEHSLSSGGSYKLRVSKDLSHVSLGKRFGKTTFPSLESAIEYIRRFHWYGERADDEGVADED